MLHVPLHRNVSTTWHTSRSLYFEHWHVHTVSMSNPFWLIHSGSLPRAPACIYFYGLHFSCSCTSQEHVLYHKSQYGSISGLVSILDPVPRWQNVQNALISEAKLSLFQSSISLCLWSCEHNVNKPVSQIWTFCSQPTKNVITDLTAESLSKFFITLVTYKCSKEKTKYSQFGFWSKANLICDSKIYILWNLL